MAGLLDFLNTDDGKLGLAMLAAAGPSAVPQSFGQRLQGAMQTVEADKQNTMKMGLLKSQIEENASQAKLREQQTAQALRRNQMINDWMQQLQGVTPQANAAVIAQTGNLAPTNANAALQTQNVGLLSANNPLSGLPMEAVKADLALNDGKNVSEWMFKRGVPDIQVSNGYAYDKNRVQPGFLPQLNVSQNGQTSMVTIDPRTGLPTVSAPQGAFNTYAGYRNLDEGTKANFDPTTVTPQGENPQMTTRGALVKRLNQIDPKVQAARDADRKAILQQEVTRAEGELNAAISKGDQSAAARAQADLAALRRELGGKSPTVGMPLQSDEEKLRATKGVEADASRNVDLAGQAQKSKDTLANIQQARALLSQGPTSSGVGALVDSGLGLVGKSTKSADVASKLDTLSGWMVSNVPRMEGPQSNFDVKNYQTMAGLVGDRTKPLSQRLAALDTLEQLQQKYAHLNGGGNAVNAGGATGSWDQPKPQANMLTELPKTAPKGQKVRDTATGKVLQFNGLSWVEVK